ncbi:patatin-like phospholipase family protein [Methylobacterium sp. B4]|uniref:patatin-like phospholipase family protein n=1 Tax=Methylobacterium sp. B4 TaxID=1938755 RepID=UPI000D76FADE|nr:patatin-like phospholipase family protein [Methylobacterium sp. B4]PXW59867.1 patatin-like phospholipase [Methylobacterium sp. B4]
MPRLFNQPILQPIRSDPGRTQRAVPKHGPGRHPGWGRTLARATLALGLAAGPSQGALAAEKARKPADERPSYTAAQALTARPEGLPASVRIPGDDATAFQALIDGAARASDPWLVLSGGGENGAFAAGLLAGWSQRGDRPDFGVITGVSTGALIAPFAFVAPALGARADAALKENYTEISAADVFEFGATRDSLTDTWPLKERIARMVTPDLLKAVAAEHAKGRRLLIATTQVDSERPVLWDMGAIAARSAATGDPRALALFRAIVLASTAVPGVFPPVAITAEPQDGAKDGAKNGVKNGVKDAAKGEGKGEARAKPFEELHDDGGAMAPFYLAPAAALEGETRLHLPTNRVYLVVNNRLEPEFQMASRTTLSVLGRTMSAAIKAQTRAALALTKAYAGRTGLDLRVALIDERFTKTSDRPFDQGYMRALFAHGEALAREGSAFTQAHPPAAAAGRENRRASEPAGAVTASR